MHTQTVLIGFAATEAVCAVVMALLRRQAGKSFSGLGLWLAAFAVQAAAILVLAARSLLPSGLAIVLGNTGVLAGVVLFHLGLVRLAGGRARWVAAAAVLVACAAADGYFTVVAPSLAARTIVFSAALAVLCAEPAWFALRGAPAEVRGALRKIGVLFAVCVVCAVTRIAWTLAHPPTSAFLDLSVSADGWILLANQVITLGIAFTALLLVNRLLLLAAREDSRRSAELYSARCRAEEERAGIEQQLRQAQKMESIGRLAGGVAHDFNNLLGVILGSVDLAAADLPAAHPAREELEQIRNAAQRSADLTRQLLTFASRQPTSPRVLDLNGAIGRALGMLRRLLGEEISLVWEPGTDVPAVRLDPSHLDQILANLCVNARDAMGGSGRLLVATTGLTLPAGGEAPAGRYAEIRVSDSGCGMSPEVAEHCFEPFFTTKEFGRGTGLGLSMVYGIVRQSGGFVELHTAPGQGASFGLRLPAVDAAAAGEAAPAPPQPGGGGTVLVVEDEAAVRRMVRRILDAAGYTVLTAATPTEALEVARGHAGEIALVVTDVVLPEMRGPALWRSLATLRPRARCLFMSGYAADDSDLDPRAEFIAKPFSADALLGRVRAILARAE